MLAYCAQNSKCYAALSYLLVPMKLHVFQMLVAEIWKCSENLMVDLQIK
jgi:hypothetical protein